MSESQITQLLAEFRKIVREEIIAASATCQIEVDDLEDED